MLGTMSRKFTAQEIRTALVEYGFTPLCRIVNAEHFVRDGQRVTVVYKGDAPEVSEVLRLDYASAIDRGDYVEIVVH